MNMGYLLSRCCTGVSSYLDKNKTALVFEEERYTYSELNEKVNRVANSLTGLGLKKGEGVCVLARNCSEWVVAFFAIAKLGGIVIPVNFAFKSPEVEHIAKDSGCKYFIVGEDLIPVVEPIRQRLSQVREFISISNGQIKGYIKFESLEEGSATESEVDVGLDDILHLAYTSGTTGSPKGVILTHGNMIWNTISNLHGYEVTEDDIYLCIPSLSWMAGFHHQFLATMWQGGTVILLPTGGMDMENILGLIEKERATLVFLVPALIKRWVDSPELKKYDISSLRILSTGAEPVGATLIHRFHELYPNVAICEAYGLTEGGMFSLMLKKRYALEKAGRTGKPGWATTMRLVDDEYRDVPVGTQGEIIIRTPEAMKGYWHNPEATQEIMRGGWLHTGDLGTCDEDGFISITGRKKDMIVSGGLNVYPAEVENVIYKNPKVAEVAIIGIPDPKWGEVGKAIIRPKPGEVITEEEVLKPLKETVANYKVPKQFEFTQEPLPRTTSGKLKKWELVAREKARKANKE